MGRLIHFPIERVRGRRYGAAPFFTAFGELDTIERAQLKLFGACVCSALLFTLGLQLAVG